MEINTHVPFGSANLSYPHVTKKDNGLIHFVTTKEKLASVGDIIFDSFDQQTRDGIQTKYLQQKASVLEIVEQRPAKGNHRDGINPVFQLLRYA